ARGAVARGPAQGSPRSTPGTIPHPAVLHHGAVYRARRQDGRAGRGARRVRADPERRVRRLPRKGALHDRWSPGGPESMNMLVRIILPSGTLLEQPAAKVVAE